MWATDASPMRTKSKRKRALECFGVCEHARSEPRGQPVFVEFAEVFGLPKTIRVAGPS